MSLAFVFPGQGSQSVGMLDGFSDNPAVQEVLAVADRALGERLSQLIAQGPAEALGLTVNTQPAMLVAAYACYAAWRAAGGPEPAAVAGHSLGEYTALTVAGALDLAEAVPLVRLRAQAMQDAVPVGVGGMAAILGLDDAAVQAACAKAREEGPGEVVEPANFNAPSQVVIAGHKAAGERLSNALATVNLRKPRIALVNNVDVAVETEPARIVDALVRQSYGPVRWVEVVRKLKSLGVHHVIEFGPGKVLAGLVPRIDKELKASAVFDPATLASTLQEIGQ